MLDKHVKLFLNGGTTNIELIELAKDIHSYVYVKIPCICKDKTNQCSTNNTPINIIVNFNDSDNNINGHGCLNFINDDQKVYYSSFGDPIPNQVKEFMMKVDDRKILSSNFQIQDFNTDTCRLYCNLILFLLNNTIKFEDIIIGIV